MGAIFKKFGQGILYILVLPLLLLAFAVFGVYGVFLFIVLMIKSIVLFFKGKSLNSELPEDIEARNRLHPKPVEPNPNVNIETRDSIFVETPVLEKPEEKATPIIDTTPEATPIEEKAEPIDYTKNEEIFSNEPVEEKADLSEFIKDEEPEDDPAEEPKEEPVEEIKEEPEEEEIPYYKDPNSNIKKVKTDTNFNDDDDNLFEDWRDK